MEACLPACLLVRKRGHHRLPARLLPSKLGTGSRRPPDWSLLSLALELPLGLSPQVGRVAGVCLLPLVQGASTLMKRKRLLTTPESWKVTEGLGEVSVEAAGGVPCQTAPGKPGWGGSLACTGPTAGFRQRQGRHPLTTGASWGRLSPEGRFLSSLRNPPCDSAEAAGLLSARGGATGALAWSSESL